MVKDKDIEIKPSTKKGILISKAIYPEKIKYGQDYFMIPPKGKMPIDDISLLGPLPDRMILKEVIVTEDAI